MGGGGDNVSPKTSLLSFISARSSETCLKRVMARRGYTWHIFIYFAYIYIYRKYIDTVQGGFYNNNTQNGPWLYLYGCCWKSRIM